MMSTQKILLVEDNLVEARGLTRLLEHEGYTVVHAEDAQEAVHRLRAEKPDLVILDVGLPVKDPFAAAKWDGLELLKWMRSMGHGSTPVIIQTGLSVAEVQRRLGDGPVPVVFHKPASPAELLSSVRRALGKDGPPSAAAA
jgi:CheY-like chemotaxis protein